jgi:integrase/recombinase XerD
VGVQAFLVRLPSRVRYWTVVDDTYRVVAGADGYLQHLRLGQDAAESTTKAYAEALALYLRWCEQTSRDWRTAADRLGGFITWLKHTPADPDAPVTGPGVKDVRSAGRINRVLAVVRGFLRHGVVIGEVPSDVLAILYDISDDRHLPVDVRGECSSLRYVARPRHRLSETETVADRATDAEVVALLGACRSARDRFIVLAMARAGLRRGELCGLRREDMHVVTDATMLGCRFPGAHLHVHRRDNPNGAWAKSRRARVVPIDELLVLAYDGYWFEREDCRPARGCDFVLVNLFREPLGAPMRPGALNELLTALSGRAELGREIRPHMLRHGFGSNVLDAGGALDEAQALLGHISPASTQVYLHPSGDRLRQAVERVAARTMRGAGATPGTTR